MIQSSSSEKKSFGKLLIGYVAIEITENIWQQSERVVFQALIELSIKRVADISRNSGFVALHLIVKRHSLLRNKLLFHFEHSTHNLVIAGQKRFLNEHNFSL